jgi:hypothetical protein
LKEKAKIEQQINPSRKKESETSISLGWVSWAWKGVPTTKLPKSKKPSVSQLPKWKRADDKKPNITFKRRETRKDYSKKISNLLHSISV